MVPYPNKVISGHFTCRAGVEHALMVHGYQAGNSTPGHQTIPSVIADVGLVVRSHVDDFSCLPSFYHLTLSSLWYFLEGWLV